MQGLILRQTIENLQQLIVENGKPVIVDNQGTVELLNHSFNITYNRLIDIKDIETNMVEYYKQHNIDYNTLMELEQGEYAKIQNAMLKKFKLFDDDIHSRRVLWTDDCCISLIHYLVRNNKIHCYIHLRSSDVVNKLFSDLFLIHRLTRVLQDKLCIENVTINVNGHSMHKLVFSDLNNI